ncbi:MAG TPA: 30S ribosomal protein S1, partial [Chthonomonadales bacterium]|nr:30S ribosomal protein S1 [Chthonomonadales bacterium]
GAAPAEEPAPAQTAAPSDYVDSPPHPEITAPEDAPQQKAEAAAEPGGSGEAGAAPEADTAVFDQAMQALDLTAGYDRSLKQLREGDVITGTVMSVDREGVLVDVGAKSEGIIRPNELSRDAASNMNPESIVSVGDKIKVYVLQPENQDGNPILSKKRADFEQAWEKVQHSKDSNETIHAMVTDRVKGGLVVDLGIRGFVPASHVANGSLKTNLDRYVGQSIPLKVIEVDKERRKVVLSNRLAIQEQREAKSHETRSSLSAGQIRRGTVRRLTNYGAFVDLGGIDGLLHISEMSWTRINDPKEVLHEGQELDVLILKLDLEQNRVSLGLRQILPDPWSEISTRYNEGDVITGTITRVVPFGAFVQVEGGVEGIIPNAEMGRRGRPSGPLVAGEEVTVKIIALRPEERKMTLSLRALQAPEEREVAPVRETTGSPSREGRRGRSERDRDEREDFGRYAPGRQQDEPRFTIGDAVAAQRKERSRRERRVAQEDEEDLSDIEIEEEGPAGEQTEGEPDTGE